MLLSSSDHKRRCFFTSYGHTTLLREIFFFFFFEKGDLSENEKKAEWMPTNLFYIEDAPRSLSQSQKEYARRAPKRGRRERLESEIGGVFVVFVGGGDLRNLFFWRQFL